MRYEMKRPKELWGRISLIVLILAIIGCARQAPSSQKQMMVADSARGASGVETKVAKQPMPLPGEPPLFTVAKDSLPAAMLGDNDAPAQRISSRTIEVTAKPQPSPLPSEPKPR
jgi:hypothetical protein